MSAGRFLACVLGVMGLSVVTGVSVTLSTGSTDAGHFVYFSTFFSLAALVVGLTGEARR